MALTTKAANVVKNPSVWLWTAQVLLAALFLMAGSAKLLMPPEAMKGPIDLPLAFIRFIGVAEVVGAFGLILPGLFRIRTVLTPVAALCLITIMGGAVTFSLIAGGVPMAVLPFVAGVLLTFVAYGRLRLAPLPTRRAARLVLQHVA